MSKSTTEVTIEAPAGADVTALAICAAHDNRPDELLEIFHDLQHDLGYVPEAALPAIAEALNRSRAEVYGVLTFYHEFRRAIADQADLVVKLDRQLMLSAGLDKPDESREIRWKLRRGCACLR